MEKSQFFYAKFSLFCGSSRCVFLVENWNMNSNADSRKVLLSIQLYTKKKLPHAIVLGPKLAR